MYQEKRQYQRIRQSLPIKLSDAEFDAVTETKDISANGAYCSVDKDIPPMTILKITLLIPLMKRSKKVLKKVICKGVVVRKEYVRHNGKKKYNIGIFFNDIKDTDRKIILSYVKSPNPVHAS